MYFFRTHLKERFLADLRKARENYKGDDLVKVCRYVVQVVGLVEETLKHFLNR